MLRKEFILLDGMARQDANLRERNWHKHLETSYRAGCDFLTLGCMAQSIHELPSEGGRKAQSNVRREKGTASIQKNHQGEVEG
ncbi:MAG: hypothetical protein LBG05_04195 [Treponema sp.]|nr:hypothetical protein [Treponema sp.]